MFFLCVCATSFWWIKDLYILRCCLLAQPHFASVAVYNCGNYWLRQRVNIAKWLQYAVVVFFVNAHVSTTLLVVCCVVRIHRYSWVFKDASVRICETSTLTCRKQLCTETMCNAIKNDEDDEDDDDDDNEPSGIPLSRIFFWITAGLRKLRLIFWLAVTARELTFSATDVFGKRTRRLEISVLFYVVLLVIQLFVIFVWFPVSAKLVIFPLFISIFYFLVYSLYLWLMCVLFCIFEDRSATMQSTGTAFMWWFNSKLECTF